MKCTICGGNAGLMASKLGDGRWICGSCLKKAGGVKKIGELRLMSTDKIQEIVLGNDAEPLLNGEFSPSVSFGKYLNIDENSRIIEVPKSAISQNRAIKEALRTGVVSSIRFSFDDVISVEILENGSAVTSGGAGSAAVGGALFGAAGMVAGSVVGKKKTTNICESLQIKVTLNNIEHPAVFIDMLNGKTSTLSQTYQNAYEEAQKIISALNVIIRGNSPIGSTAADEIKKYKELLDMGAITQEEYDRKKTELLKYTSNLL